MAKVITDNQYYSDIANAIRDKNGETTTYKPSEMATAIENISGGASEPIIVNEDFSLASSSTAIREIYSYTAKFSGNFRSVSVSVLTNTSNNNAYLQILKNGEVLESSGYITSSTLTSVSFSDIYVTEGDVITVQTNWTGSHTDCYWKGNYCYGLLDNVTYSYLEKLIRYVGFYNAGCGQTNQTFNAVIGNKYLVILERSEGTAGISSGAEVDTILINNLRTSAAASTTRYFYVAIIKATDTTVTALGTHNLALYMPL